MIICLVHILSFFIIKTSSSQLKAVGSNISHPDPGNDLRASHPFGPRQTHEVQLNYGISANRKSYLTCEVLLSSELNQALLKSGNQSLSHVYLRCPQVKTEICYVDCTPACIFDDIDGCVVPSALSAVIGGCRFEQHTESGSLLFEYTIAMEALDRTGSWNCEYQGVSALRPLKLQASSQLLSTTKTASTFDTTTTKIAATPEKVIEKARSKSDRLVGSEGTSCQENKDFNGNVLKALLRLPPEIVMALIALTVVAVLLNIVLFIRCAMTKCYFESLRHGKPDHYLRRCLCFEPVSASPPSTKCHHHNRAPQGHVPYGLMLPPLPTPPPPPPPFFTPYQVDQRSEISDFPPYAQHISLNDAATAKLSTQQPPGTLSTASSSDTGASNPFSVSLSGTLPIYYPSRLNNIEINSLANDSCNQTKVYLIKVDDYGRDLQSSRQQQLLQKVRADSSMSNTVYDEEALNIGGRGTFQTVTPTLVRLSGSTESPGLILCHRLADDGSGSSLIQSEVDFMSASRLLSQPQMPSQPYILLQSVPPPPPPPSSQLAKVDVCSS